MSLASSFERQMLDLINNERTSRGLDALQLEQRLNASAEEHSAWMLMADVFDHTGIGGSSATQRMRDAGFDFSGSWSSGENLAAQSERGAAGIADDVVDLHNALMNSPGHRANILNVTFDYVGIGIVEGNFDGFESVMVTQNFASTGGSVVLDTGAATPPAPMAPAINGLEYIASYPDLIAAFGSNGTAGAAHFTANGQGEGRSVSFDGLEYIASFDDLIRAFGADRDAGSMHFIHTGHGEGRAVSFDGLQYLASHADLIAAFGSDADLATAHFINHGIDEGRARDSFDAQQYINNYADLQAAFGMDQEAATHHYITNGLFEGRTDEFLFG